MEAPVASVIRRSPPRQLAALVVLLVGMYLCARTLRFTNDTLNLGFRFLFFAFPFLAVRPILHLRGMAKALSALLVVPILAFSLMALFFSAILDVPAAIGHHEMSRELGTVVRGRYSVHLLDEETAGGAVGPHGVGLEQRRTILPGLYAVRYLDYFEGATQGTISFVGPDEVSLYIPIAGYHEDQKDVRRTYSLKQWLWF